MRRELDAFNRKFDLLVVGAGIHGACIARLAALAGLDVALIERGDFGAATSRNSAKLIHGGLRYIQHFDIPRIHESAAAQRAWFRFAPHLMRPLRFVMPTCGYGTRSPAALGAGMLAYHLVAAGRNRGIPAEIRLPRSGLLTRSEMVSSWAMLDGQDVTGGAYWYDGQMHDAGRVTLECIWDAVEAGAVVANHLSAASLLHDARGVRGVVARDQVVGQELEIQARLTVNATGPWVDELLASGPAGLNSPRTTAWTRNMNLVTRPLFQGDAALGFAGPAGAEGADRQGRRLYFVSPWHGCSIVGTSHELHEGGAGAVDVSEARIVAFIAEVDAAAPALGVRLEDVLSVHVGLTPTEGSAMNFAKRSLVADHADAQGIEGLVSVVGTKYTTAPAVATRVVSLACRKLAQPVTVPGFSAPCRGARRVAPAAEAANEFDWASAIYGQRAPQCLSESETTGRDSDQVFRSRVRYGVEQEMVVRLSDAVLRATDWAERGMLDQGQLDWCAATLAAALGWTGERTAKELALTRAQLRRMNVRVRAVPGAGKVGEARPERHTESLPSGQSSSPEGVA